MRTKVREYARAWLLSVAMLASVLTAVTITATAASADPGCNNGGYYVLFARGSNEPIGGERSDAFKRSMVDSGILGPVAWAELGNLDGSVQDGQNVDNPSYEYPATPVTDWRVLPPFYGNSVEIGMHELVTHLNHRYDPSYPGGRSCANEKVVIGGYSQGADVVGWVLQRSDLSQAAKDHIAFVALYGDPKFHPGSLPERMSYHNPWWVRGNAYGYRQPDPTWLKRLSVLVSPIGPIFVDALTPDYIANFGALLPRAPYVPDEFRGRFGSWCAYGDGICNGTILENGQVGTHSDAYHGDNGWIANSADEIARVASGQIDPYFHGIPPNGAVVENYDGGKHKYVAVGGSLMYIPASDDIWGYVSQMQRLYPSGQFHDILRMRNDEIHALEFNWGGEAAHRPGNNSFFYERGNPTQYIMQYGLAFPIASVDELSYLSGIDRAIMVPAGAMGSVKAGAGRLPAPPNGTILHTLAQSDPDYEYQPDKLYWANNYTVQECIRVVKGAGHQRIPQSMADFFAAAGRYQGNTSACDFGPGRVLYGPKDDGSPGVERWYMYGNNTVAHPYRRHQYASPFALQCHFGQNPNEVMISRQGLNQAPVGEPLQCPDNSAVRNQQNGEVFWVIGGVLHLVPSYDTLACLTRGIPGSPTDMAESLLATVPRAENTSCSFENKLLRGPDGRVYWIKGGQKRYVGNPLIQNCIAVRTGAGAAWNMPQSTLDHIVTTDGAYCPYPDSINFVRGDGQSQVWLVYPDGTRRHALSLCPGTDPRFTVYVVPAGEVDGHRYVGDWSANAGTCAAVS